MEHCWFDSNSPVHILGVRITVSSTDFDSVGGSSILSPPATPVMGEQMWARRVDNKRLYVRLKRADLNATSLILGVSSIGRAPDSDSGS